MLVVVVALLVLNLLPSASLRCACVPGSPMPAALVALQQGNAGFAADLPLLRKAVGALDDDACAQRLWREAFILSASRMDGVLIMVHCVSSCDETGCRTAVRQLRMTETV